MNEDSVVISEANIATAAAEKKSEEASAVASGLSETVNRLRAQLKEQNDLIEGYASVIARKELRIATLEEEISGLKYSQRHSSDA